MKKIIGIIIFMIMIGTNVVPVTGFFLLKTDNKIETEHSEKYTNCECELKKSFTYQPSLLTPFITNDTAELSKKPTINKDLPDYFNWRDYKGEDWTTPAKDQGNCGSCWLFAAMGVLESIINIRENCSALDPDLSEQYVLSCLKGAGSCRGGMARSAFRYINLTDRRGNYCNGVVLESCMPYQADDDIECSDKCDDWEERLIPIVDYGYWNPDGSENDINAIKTQIMELGPVAAVMLFTYYIHGFNNLEEWGWTHHSPDDYYAYPGPVENANHQVVLVGWKDDPNIGNGGYWIVKNSCSSEWGYDGFFNIEYGSLNIDSIEIDWVDYDPESYNNWAPNVDSGGIYSGSVNELISFDGSKTVDPDGDIIEYKWDFGGVTEKKGVTQTFTYDNQGIYPVILTVIDNNGNIGIDETWVFIDESNDPPENPVLRGRKIGQSEKEYKYTFYTDDPDGDDVYYYLNWGDTYWTGLWHPWIGPYKSGEEIVINNIWDANGEYVVRVKAKDKYGAESDWATLPVEIPIDNSFNDFNSGIFRLIQRFSILEFPL